MERYVVFVLFFIIASCVTSPMKQYRKDYIYNSKTDAFYKFHVEGARTWRAKEICIDEGAKLMVPTSSVDIQQVHGMLKQYPDIGDFVRVDSDGQEHQPAEENPILELDPSASSERDLPGTCEVVTRSGEIETSPCFRQLPFMCKVENKDTYYDRKCNVYGKDYVYKSGPGYSSCYKVSKIAYIWSEAYADCEAQNAHLVIINSQAEADAVRLLLQEAPPVNGADCSWFFLVGFRAENRILGQPKVFKTIFNQTLEEAGYAQWSENEPNDAGNEDCGSFFKNNGKLNDLFCTKEFAFVCEKEIANDLTHDDTPQ